MADNWNDAGKGGDHEDGDRGNGLPEDVRLLLAEIEKEPIPERLLRLAEELQRALARRRPGDIVRDGE